MRQKPAIKKEPNKNVGIGIVNLATYTSPKIVEVRNQEWIGYGADNNYFGYLQDRINGSPTNNAIVNGISQMIFGQGLDASDKVLKPEDFAQAMLLFDNDTVERLCYDFKAMGQCALQVVYSIDKTRIVECNHFPVETLRSGKCNDDGEVEVYFYAEDWTKVNRQNKPLEIPAFGFGNGGEEILFIKPYKTGFYYYSPPDWQGGLQYCELEEEISNYHLNNIMNGLAPSMLINFNNGTPTEDEQRDIERSITQKFSGTSNAGRFILSFNDNNNYGATVTPVQLSDAHNQYQFLSDESMRKIMVSHRVISPMLLGIKDNSGFGNNAEELKTATILMQNTVIKPFQNLLIKEFNTVLEFNNIALNLYFKSLQPLDANNDLTNTVEINPLVEKINALNDTLANKVIENLTTEEIRSLIGLKSTLAPQEVAPIQPETLSAVDLSEFGEEIDLEKYELIDSRAVDYEQETNLDAQLSVHLSTGTAIPNASSIEDSPIYKVRYRYGGNGSPERSFCKQMMGANKIYRKEDINRMSTMTVNPGFGMSPNPNEPYDIFLWKGGGLLSEEFPNGTCKHFWIRETYASKDRKSKVDIYSPNAEIVSPSKSIAENGFIPTVNDQRAYIAPHDMK
jgi:hypothetical protein